MFCELINLFTEVEHKTTRVHDYIYKYTLRIYIYIVVVVVVVLVVMVVVGYWW